MREEIRHNHDQDERAEGCKGSVPEWRDGPWMAEAREQREASHFGTEGRGKRAEKKEKIQEMTKSGREKRKERRA